MQSNNSKVTCRSISLTGKPSVQLCFRANYTALIDSSSNQFNEIEVASDAPNILKFLHDEAMNREWATEVAQSTEKDGEVLSKEQQEWLVNCGPGILLQPSPVDTRQESKVFWDHRLSDRARIILERKTIFLLPEGSSSMSQDDEKSVVASIAAQLGDLLKYKHDLDFSFIRMGVRIDKLGMLDLIIENLHGELTAPLFENLAPERAGPILLCGPTGTGKSYATKWLTRHLNKPKCIPVNLSAVTETMLETRIRGYAPGAYTGANKNGGTSWFEKAHNGILFLDEFQSVSIPYQIQFLDLLNAVSDRVDVARVSDDDNRKSYNVKVVLAINEDIQELIQTNRVRLDLLYRIRTIVQFPALTQRLWEKPTDLGLLLLTYRWRCAPTINETSSGIDTSELETGQLHCLFPDFMPDAIDDLMTYDWPGNLRELERVASDLYWESDRDRNPRIERRHTARAISVFRKAMSGTTAPATKIDPSASPILDQVQKIFRKHNFVNADMRPELKIYKLAGPPQLRKFIEENRAYLSADVVRESRIRKFMKWDKISSDGKT